MNILICDNNLLILKLLKLILQKAETNVFIAQDGIKAAEIINQVEINLIITEIQVPFKSGLELILEAKQKNPEILTIVLSQVHSEKYIQQAFRLGASDYITKPFDPEILLIRIKKLLLRKV